MALETATTIDQLVSANPASTDLVAAGNSHIKLIKSTLQNTFPNVVGVVTTKTNDFKGYVPLGGIIMWGGLATAIPVGWHLADGSVVTWSDGSGSGTLPDLRNAFIVGAGSGYAVGAVGGALSATPAITVAATALTVAQLPAHIHGITDPGHAHGVTDGGHAHFYQQSNFSNTTEGGGSGGPKNSGGFRTGTESASSNISIQGAGTNITVQSQGANQGHIHTATSSAISSLPPYFALCYIVRV